jgi:rfaE bifunctional protein nucleotidyltransferase chain/domain
VNTQVKILSYTEAKMAAQKHHQQGIGVALSTGTFDVIHAGHLDMLERASDLGVLFVGVNDDVSVRMLKGPTRPINTLINRLKLLAGFQCVAVVFPIHDTNVAQCINDILPTHWVKGADYSMETLNRHEVEAARLNSVEIVLMPLVHGQSTTGILAKLRT